MMSTVRSNILVPVRIAAWTLAVLITVLSVVPPHLRPETELPHNFEHFLIYVATGLAFGIGYDRKHIRVAILLLIFTATTEIAQLFVPGRHARLSDFIVDAFAMLAGLMVASLTSRIPKRI